MFFGCTACCVCRLYGRSWYCLLAPNVDMPKRPLDPLNSIRSPRTILAASWDCRKCGCINDSAKNKRRCFSCRAWRDGKAPLSAASIAIADVHRGGGASFCSDENDAPNNASPRKVGSPKKRGEKRKSPSRGLGGTVIHLLPMPLPPNIQPMCSITPPPLFQFRSLTQAGIAGEEPRRTSHQV